jgi:hypothetical protein
MTDGWSLTSVRIMILCGAALLLPLAGCGGDGLKEIHGTITYRGQPLPKGVIEFLPPDGNGPTAAAPVVNGEFKLRVGCGRKAVRIQGFRASGKRAYSSGPPGGPPVEEQEQFLPERFNANSTLVQEITADKSIYDFHLDDLKRASQ